MGNFKSVMKRRLTLKKVRTEIKTMETWLPELFGQLQDMGDRLPIVHEINVPKKIKSLKQLTKHHYLASLWRHLVTAWPTDCDMATIAWNSKKGVNYTYISACDDFPDFTHNITSTLTFPVDFSLTVIFHI